MVYFLVGYPFSSSFALTTYVLTDSPTIIANSSKSPLAFTVYSLSSPSMMPSRTFKASEGALALPTWSFSTALFRALSFEYIYHESGCLYNLR